MAVLRYETSIGAIAKVSPQLGNVGLVGLDSQDLCNLNPEDAGAIGYMLIEGMRQARGEHPLIDGEFDVNQYLSLIRQLGATPA